MTASAVAVLTALHVDAQRARGALREAVGCERHATVRFIDEAKRHGWSWERIGTALGVTATGARRYYERNRKKVHGGV